jgi:hypothetical protein
MPTKKKVGARRAGPPAKVAVKAAKVEPEKLTEQAVQAKERVAEAAFKQLLLECEIPQERIVDLMRAFAQSVNWFDLEKRWASASSVLAGVQKRLKARKK